MDDRVVIYTEEAHSLRDWVSVNVGPYDVADAYNPTFEQLKSDRVWGKAICFGYGSRDTMFGWDAIEQARTIWDYRIWHDSMHLKYNLDFSLESELQLSFLLTREAFTSLGWTEHSAMLVGLDLRLHIMHYHLWKKHPEKQRDMLRHALTHNDHSTLTKVW